MQENGTSIIRQDEPNADYTYLSCVRSRRLIALRWRSGVVRNAKGQPLPGAFVDVWHDSTDGLYDRRVSSHSNLSSETCAVRIRASPSTTAEAASRRTARAATA